MAHDALLPTTLQGVTERTPVRGQAGCTPVIAIAQRMCAEMFTEVGISLTPH